MRSRTALASLLTAAAIVFSVVATATPATASALDVTCVGSQTTSYNPALTQTPQSVTVSTSTQYGPCTSTTVPELTSGSRSANFPYPNLSCLNFLDSASVTYTITWNTGQQSTISGNTTVTTAGTTVVTVTGNVTAGLFAGDSVISTVTGPATDITLCTAGLGSVSSIYSLVTLEITSLP